jgi:catechol 2,3-dioxygenase-like lactoylglutathione lyase family enzyme
MSLPEPRLVGVYETVLYAPDVTAAATFYSEVLGLRPLEKPDELSAVFRLDDGGVLLVFDHVRASVPGRAVPSHGATGLGHVAFAVARGSLDGLAAQLGPAREWRSSASSPGTRAAARSTCAIPRARSPTIGSSSSCEIDLANPPSSAKTCSRSRSRLMSSMFLSAIGHMTGCPPKVIPCENIPVSARNGSMTRFVATTPPIAP